MCRDEEIRLLREKLEIAEFHIRNQSSIIKSYDAGKVFADIANIRQENRNLVLQNDQLTKWNRRLVGQINEKATKKYHSFFNK